MLWLVDLAENTLNNWLKKLFHYRCPIVANCPITLSVYNFAD